MAKTMPSWLVLVDGGLRCLRCGTSEQAPVPMPAAAFSPWCEYVGASHQGCRETGRVDVVPMCVEDWAHGHDTGVSSMAVYRHMSGVPRAKGGAFGDHPLDPSDFGRCYRLLALAPAWRARIGEMAQYGRQWAALANAWDELTAMYEAVLASGQRDAPAMYRRLAELTDRSRAHV